MLRFEKLLIKRDQSFKNSWAPVRLSKLLPTSICWSRNDSLIRRKSGWSIIREAIDSVLSKVAK